MKGNKSLEFWMYVPSQSCELDVVRCGAPSRGSVIARGGPALGGEEARSTYEFFAKNSTVHPGPEMSTISSSESADPHSGVGF